MSQSNQTIPSAAALVAPAAFTLKNTGTAIDASLSTVRRLITKKELQVVHLPGVGPRVRRASLEAYAARHGFSL